MSSNSKDATTSTLVTPAIINDPSWPKFLTSIVSRRRLRCIEQTPFSAKELRKEFKYFSDGKVLPHEVESTLFEAFEEDDYDGALHLLTIHEDDSGGDDARGPSPPIGLVFWREVPETEMREWIDHDKLADLVQQVRLSGVDGDKRLLLHESKNESDLVRPGSELLSSGKVDARLVGDGTIADNSGKESVRVHDNTRNVEQALVSVRRESLKWLETAASKSNLNVEETSSQSPTVLPKKELSTPKTNKEGIQGISHAWIKIELLAVRPPWWGKRIGTILLACAMHSAWIRNNSRCILHVAGGLKNVPAMRLYQRFGFVPAPGLFHKPDKDIFVLGNIGLALQSLLWSETLELPESTTNLN